MRKFIVLVSIPALLVACNNKKDQQKDKPAAAFGTVQTSSTATVKITRNGATLAEYNSNTANAVLDADVMMIELNSQDTKYSFIGWVGSTTAGNYIMEEMQQKGKAAINIYNDGNNMPASLAPTKGEFTITQMNGKRCSGTFSGSRKHPDGKEYTITGAFANIPVRKIDEAP